MSRSFNNTYTFLSLSPWGQFILLCLGLRTAGFWGDLVSFGEWKKKQGVFSRNSLLGLRQALGSRCVWIVHFRYLSIYLELRTNTAVVINGPSCTDLQVATAPFFTMTSVGFRICLSFYFRICTMEYGNNPSRRLWWRRNKRETCQVKTLDKCPSTTQFFKSCDTKSDAFLCYAFACLVASVVSNSLQPHGL